MSNHLHLVVQQGGAPAVVFVDYTLWLPNGTQVDSGTNARLTITTEGEESVIEA
jgi:hypothetical protein